MVLEILHMHGAVVHIYMRYRVTCAVAQRQLDMSGAATQELPCGLNFQECCLPVQRQRLPVGMPMLEHAVLIVRQLSSCPPALPRLSACELIVMNMTQLLTHGFSSLMQHEQQASSAALDQLLGPAAAM